MKYSERRRPEQTANHALHQQNDYIAYCPDKCGRCMQCCDDNGVIAMASSPRRRTRLNTSHKSYKNRSFDLMLKNVCIYVKYWTTGAVHSLSDDWPHDFAKRWQLTIESKRKSKVIDQQRRRQQSEAAQLTTRLWCEAIDYAVPGDLTSKGLLSIRGARWHERLSCWQVMATDVCGNNLTVQKIDSNQSSNKFYQKGGPIAGVIVVVRSLIKAGRVVISEGFPNGGKLREKPGEIILCTLVACYLLTFCTTISAHCTSIVLIVASDDYRNSEHNKVTEEATAMGGECCFSTFCNNSDSCADSHVPVWRNLRGSAS